MNNDNYIVIQGFMRNELKLKGNELMVYALIYGFSQDEESEFTGSVGYIADWIGSTRQTVFNVLKSLCDKGLLIKKEELKCGIKFCSYSAILPPVKKFDRGVVKNFDRGSQKIRPNNIDNNIINIIYYLNKKAGTNYKHTTKGTQSVINARLSEGFTEDDFKSVIDKKVARWKGTEMEQYLRPQTLFGTKMESYLNQNIVKEDKKKDEVKVRRYEEYKPEPEVEAVEMPEEIRNKLKGMF